MDDRTPPGERDVFNLLAASSDDWVVLHSLDLAPWNRGLRTEIDFVAVIPDAGILCIEVKSHSDLTFDGSRWYPSSITRSPFKQAADGSNTFYRHLKRIAPQFRHVPVVHFCIFPKAIFDLSANLSIAPWELMDLRAFGAFRSGEAFTRDLESRVARAVEADGRLRRLDSRLSKQEIEQIVTYCVPVQKRRPSAHAEIEQRERELEQNLREQQKPVLHLAALNERVLVSGGAGTGKTFIAMEVARRRAESGLRVGLFCFNRLVGDWLSETMGRISPSLPGLVVGRAVRVLAEMTGTEIPSHATHSFWSVDLPRKIEEKLTDPDFRSTALFDYLVIDEAQDVLAKTSLWDCLSQFLVGGAEHGSFILLGDFENQVLADREQLNRNMRALEHPRNLVRWSLTENCRNYRIIGDTAVRLAGLGEDVYSAYMRHGGGLQNYDIAFYDNEQQQLDQVRLWLREFREKGYRPRDVTLLSFRADDRSAAARLQASGYKLRPAWKDGDAPSFATIHAFKGMESKMIILTDVMLGDQEFHRDLFYTGITRATETVRVSCDSNSKTTLLDWLSEGDDK